MDRNKIENEIQACSLPGVVVRRINSLGDQQEEQKFTEWLFTETASQKHLFAPRGGSPEGERGGKNKEAALHEVLPEIYYR